MAGGLLSVLSVAAMVEACSCGTPPSPSSALREADRVFRGVVVNSTPMEIRAGAPSSNDPVVLEFDVKEVWKGAMEARVSLWTAREESSCGYPFEVGREYLVYTSRAMRKPVDGLPGLTTGRCSRTALLEEAGEDLADLPEGKELAPDKAAEQTPEKRSEKTDESEDRGASY